MWFRASAQAVLIVGHLLRDIRRRKTGQTGVLGTALSIRQMTHPAGIDVGFSAACNDLRHGRVIARKPVVRGEEVAKLRKRESDVASRKALRDAVIRWRLKAGRKDGVGPRRSFLRRGRCELSFHFLVLRRYRNGNYANCRGGEKRPEATPSDF